MVMVCCAGCKGEELFLVGVVALKRKKLRLLGSSFADHNGCHLSSRDEP